MQVEIVDSLPRLEALRGEWSRFLATLPAMTPFQSPDWLLAWWRHFGSGDLHVVVCRDCGDLAAIVPCFRHEWNGRSQLTLLGSGISDYLEPAIAPHRREQVLDELHAHLLADRDWEICEWQDLGAESPLAALTPLQAETPCSEIKLDGTFEEYWARRGKDLRRNLRRYGERADNIGSTRLRVTDAPDLLEDLIRLHGIRWHKQGEVGMIVANHSAEFLRDVTREFARRDIFRFFSLRFAGEIVAVSVGFFDRNTLYSYLSAFDPQYETLGFGRRLLHESLRYAYEEGYRAWNFGRGEEAYKFSFGADRIPKGRLILRRAAAHTA
jgi:CelD/BcsL family acetyltransferase involved in cellulose biosynthesis